MKRLNAEDIAECMPPGGFFKDKEWLSSPEPLCLSKEVYAQLSALGGVLESFLSASNALYLDSKRQDLDPWVATLLDQGKPTEIVRIGSDRQISDEIPRVIRPDVLLTETGISITEIDSTPGGIGLTAWLNKLYADFGWDVVGGEGSMVAGFEEILQGGRVIFSKEALGYRPEIEWIVSQFAGDCMPSSRIINEWDFDVRNHHSDFYYRYFELWDWDCVLNFPHFKELTISGTSVFTAPMKAFLEEKLWLALLWSPGLRAEWIERMGQSKFDAIQSYVPRGWVMDPSPIPYHSVYPGLGIQGWEELKSFSQKDRRLVIKVSGFSPIAWGSRGVFVGHDLSIERWKSTIDHALDNYGSNPRILQRFDQPKIIKHPYFEPVSGEVRIMEGRVRLCPYYFRGKDNVKLGGVLATICPKEKKMIHGMSESIMVPCVVG